jgi:eukaryotic-like serine/threonine-protein kinase
MNQSYACRQCGAMLSESTLDGMCPACAAGLILGLPPGREPPSPLEQLQSDLSGRTPADFGEFELIEEIARGGMGVVYKARQKRLNRLVALKMILAGRFAGEEQIKRFRAEAEAAASLRHPNILTIHDIGEWAGQHYFCMDLIEGPNLAGLVRDHPLSHRKAAWMVLEVAQAVQYAHEHGIIHRDLKPSNIIIDPQGRPHVTDFGLAKRLDEDSDMTRSGQVLGSPSFTAPEQAGGRSQEAGPLSDVYALGAILYFLLVGRPPFMAETLEQTLSLVLVRDPIPPRRLDPGVPRDLETICLKCLEKDPEKRYATAGQLAEELGRCLRGEPIRARPISPIGRMSRWCRRKPAVAGLLATVGLVFLTGFLGVLWQWRRAEGLARSESNQRGRAEHALNQLELQRVEDLLDNGQAAVALAELAHAQRQTPTNEAVAARIVSLLDRRSFALPIGPPMRHDRHVWFVEFSPDGTRLVTASWDQTARIWDTQTGRPVTEPLPHADIVYSARFSPDGRRVVTASADNSARVWDARTGRPLTPPLLHQDTVVSARFSPDGLRVVTASKDKTVRIWSAEDGRPLLPAIRHGDELIDAAFAPDGQSVLSVSGQNGQVIITDAASGATRRSFHFNHIVNAARYSLDGSRIAVATRGGFAQILEAGSGRILATVRHGGQIQDAVFSPDGELLATVSSDRRALLWDAWTGDLFAELEGHQTWVKSAEFSRDGLRLLTLESGSRAYVWDVLTGQPVCQPIQAPNVLYGARFSPDGQRVAVGSIDGTVQLWTVAPGRSGPLSLSHSNLLVSLELSHDGRAVACGYADGRLILWNVTSGEVERVFQQNASVISVQFSPDGTRLLSAAADGAVTVWQRGDGDALVVHEPGVLLVRFSPDGETFLTATSQGLLRTWATATGQPLLSEPIRHGSITIWHVEYSPDGRLIASASSDFTARLWDARSGEARSPALAHRRGVRYVAFNPDGTRVVTASRDQTAAIWSVQTGQRLLQLEHDGQLRCAQFSPNGRWVVTASLDNTARVWDAVTGRAVTAPLRHQAEVPYAEFSPDSRWVATASVDGTARVWDVQSGKPVTEPLPHFHEVNLVRFTPDGRRLITQTDSTWIWDLPFLTMPPPDWLPDLAEGVAGIRVDTSGRLDSVPFDTVLALRRGLESSPSAETWTNWARWFLADRSTRALSPFRGKSAGAMTHRQSQGDSLEGCQEAVRRNPTNGLAWAQLALKTENPSASGNLASTARALHYSRRALALASEEPQVWLARAQCLEQARRSEEALAALKDGLKVLPQDRRLWQAWAEGLQRQGRLPESYAAFTRLIELSKNITPDPVPAILLKRREVGIQMNRVEQAQRDWLQAAGIPERDPAMSPNCIDLSGYYNAALHEAWHDRSRQGNDLSQVTPGRFLARGVEFDLRGIVQLSGIFLHHLEPSFPAAVKGISVGRVCAKLHFLHATGWGYSVADGAVVGKYAVHYVDGVTENIFLKKNVDLQEWFHQGPTPLADLAAAQTIDMGRNAANIPVRLFLKTWTNPRPAVPIATIDFVSEMTGAAPFLVGLTAEP